jgi:starch-binding outer membrane protein, SusD/RagB family
MNTKNITWLVLLTGALTTGSCKKWLDVSPQTQVRERTLLETEQGFKDAMIGVYLHLGGAGVYGQNLTMGFMDVLGQRYAVGSTHSFYRASLYQYADVSPKGNIAAIWSGLYTAIGNIDNLLLQIDDKKNIFTGNNYKIIKGEALALRAFMHFDLLRMFGAAPVVDANRKSIPYVTGFGRNIYPLLTVNQVIDSCLADLVAAETLLSVEKNVRNEYNQEPYLSYTRNHLNYWAAKGLQARIHLYRGNKTAALAAALDVINNGSSLFPFVTSTEASITSSRYKVYAN